MSGSWCLRAVFLHRGAGRSCTFPGGAGTKVTGWLSSSWGQSLGSRAIKKWKESDLLAGLAGSVPKRRTKGRRGKHSTSRQGKRSMGKRRTARLGAATRTGNRQEHVAMGWL